jgi:hypothetical protein
MGLSDEFWMLRHHLAPGGVIKRAARWCGTAAAWIPTSTIFADVVPGMETIQCQQSDCVAAVAAGGCFYYMRGLNCFFSEAPTKAECLQRGKTPSGGYLDCIDPECIRMETELQLDLVEQRTVDAHAVWNYEHGNRADPHFPVEADVALYRVAGIKP